jgi:hypothetical protein
MYKFLVIIFLLCSSFSNADTIQSESRQWIEKTFPIRKALESITGNQETKQKRKMGLVPPLPQDIYCAVKAIKTKLNEIIKLCNTAYNLENMEAAKQLFCDVAIKLDEAYIKLKIAQTTVTQLRPRL